MVVIGLKVRLVSSAIELDISDPTAVPYLGILLAGGANKLLAAIGAVAAAALLTSIDALAATGVVVFASWS